MLCLAFIFLCVGASVTKNKGTPTASAWRLPELSSKRPLLPKATPSHMSVINQSIAAAGEASTKAPLVTKRRWAQTWPRLWGTALWTSHGRSWPSSGEHKQDAPLGLGGRAGPLKARVGFKV